MTVTNKVQPLKKHRSVKTGWNRKMDKPQTLRWVSFSRNLSLFWLPDVSAALCDVEPKVTKGVWATEACLPRPALRVYVAFIRQTHESHVRSLLQDWSEQQRRVQSLHLPLLCFFFSVCVCLVFMLESVFIRLPLSQSVTHCHSVLSTTCQWDDDLRCLFMSLSNISAPFPSLWDVVG